MHILSLLYEMFECSQNIFMQTFFINVPRNNLTRMLECGDVWLRTSRINVALSHLFIDKCEFVM